VADYRDEADLHALGLVQMSMNGKSSQEIADAGMAFAEERGGYRVQRLQALIVTLAYLSEGLMHWVARLEGGSPASILEEVTMDRMREHIIDPR
jgi:hypothetical protein